MNIPLSDLPSVMAVQHRVLKDLKKKTGLRQRDWEVLCVCQRLSLGDYPFTTAKVDSYLQGAYFLPCLYDSIKMLLEKNYIKVVVLGKPFRPESYEMTYQGSTLVMKTANALVESALGRDFSMVGKTVQRLW